MLNLNHLNYFIALAKHLNFSKCAQELGIAQPAVSRAIKNLEASIGVDLFNRSNKRVTLTAEGEKLLRSIGPLLERIESGLQSVDRSDEQVEGIVRIGALKEFGEYKLIPLIQALSHEFPSLRVQLYFAGNQEIEQMLYSGEVDFIFGIGDIDRENIRTYALLDQNSFLMTSATNKAPSNKLNQIGYILYRKDDPLLGRYLQVHGKKQSLSRMKIISVLNSHKSMVAGLQIYPNSYAVLPEFSSSVAGALEEGALVKVGKKKIKSTIYFSYWNHEFLPSRFEAFIQFTKNFFTE